MVVCSMGLRHCGTISQSSGKQEISPGRHRLFYEVGWRGTLANIRDVDVKRFVWKKIVTRFGVPHVLISDNGLQFDIKMFRRYCGELGITNRYSTPAYPQGNGQAEAVNKVIVSGLTKRLDDAKGKWVEELPYVLWTYRTTPRKSTRETPFSMTYGAEAVIPLETGFPTSRTSSFNPREMMSKWQRVWTWLKRRGKMWWFNWPTTSKNWSKVTMPM